MPCVPLSCHVPKNKFVLFGVFNMSFIHATRRLILNGALMVGLMTGAAWTSSVGHAADLMQPQPSQADVAPGLAVTYGFGKFNTLFDMAEWMSANPVQEGAPLEHLSFTDTRGHVLTTDQSTLVGAKIRGMIYLQEPGEYQFIVRSNDGIAFFVGADQPLIVDDGVHPTRYSDPGTVMIADSGWYPLRIDYFQKKGASALEVFWMQPGETEFAPVPAAVLGHTSPNPNS